MRLCQRPLLQVQEEINQDGEKVPAGAVMSPVCSGHDITCLHLLLALGESVDAGTARGEPAQLQ